jgi:dienelactone hydrolase
MILPRTGSRCVCLLLYERACRLILHIILQTIVPDYLHGDPVPLAAMSASVRALTCSKAPIAIKLTAYQTFDITSWFKNHGTSDTRPLLDNVIATLKEQGVTTFGASGYCFGARYCMDLAFENVTKVIVMSHPSLLQIPEDL